MTNSKKFITLLLAVAFAIPLHANESKHLDDTVAAGIVFKLAYVFGEEGTWNTLETNNTETFKRAMMLISKDVSHFSDTERGIMLEKEAEKLIEFLTKAVLLTSEAPNEEAKAFLRKLGLDPVKADSAKLAPIMTARLTAYAKISNTPAWVYDRTSREQVGTPNPQPVK